MGSHAVSPVEGHPHAEHVAASLVSALPSRVLAGWLWGRGLCSRVQGPFPDLHWVMSEPAASRLTAACCVIDSGSKLLWDVAKSGWVHCMDLSCAPGAWGLCMWFFGPQPQM